MTIRVLGIVCLIAGCTPTLKSPAPTADDDAERWFLDCQNPEPSLLCGAGASMLYYRGDVARAVPHLQRPCENAYAGDACTALGHAHEYGNGVPRDLEKARAFYEKACALNDGPGCASLGLMVLDGLGGPADFQRGVELVKNGCYGADGEAVGRACLRYAEMSVDGRLPLNEKAAHHFAMGGCLQRIGKACALEGKLLAEGRGVPHANPIDGAALIKRGCELGDAQACIDDSHTGQGWIEQNRATPP